jgi:hypothetical protein
LGRIRVRASLASTPGSRCPPIRACSISRAEVPPVIARGPIHAAGTDIQVNNLDRFVLPNGALRIRHHARASHESFDPKTCLGTFSERGVYKITAGTGAYSHLTGHGHYRVQGYFIGCTENDPSNVLSVIIRAHGPLSY